MSKFIIQGGNKLQGSIKVAGFKNAATPIIAATILSKEDIILHNVPLIEDVKKMLSILVSMGAKVNWTDKNSVKINNADLDPKKMDMSAIGKLRSSILLMGAMLARFGEVRIKEPGGCQIGARSMDVHFKAFDKLGVDIETEEKYYFLKKIRAAEEEIVMTELSVTGTENIILASALNQGKTFIRLAAAEPHVQDLCWFLESLGAEIEGIGTHELRIKGARSLKGGEYTIIPDLIETGTFLSLAGATKSKITIENAAPYFMALELEKFKEAGLKFGIKYLDKSPNKNYKLANIEVDGDVKLKAVEKIHDMPYPGFAADLIQPFAVLMTQAYGESLIYDWMYEGRTKYVAELKKMGANIITSDAHRVVVKGPTPLKGKDIISFDLRAGATLIIAALSATGTSTVDNIYQVDRGYQELDVRLAKIGAKIKRLDD